MKLYLIFVSIVLIFFSCGSAKEKNSAETNQEPTDSSKTENGTIPEVNSVDNSGVDMLKVISKEEKQLPSSWDIMNEEEQQLKDKNTVTTTTTSTTSMQKIENPSSRKSSSSTTTSSIATISNENNGNPYENALSEDLKKQGSTTNKQVKNVSVEQEKNTGTSTSATIIGAVVHFDQVIKSGGRVKIRTTENGYLNNLNIPKNSIIWGTASLYQNRILINIDRIVLNDKVINNFQANIYSKEDGQLGIYVSGLDMKKQVSSEATDIGVNTASNIGGVVGNSIGGGALGGLASTIINSTGSIIRRNKNNEIEVVVPNNTKLIIK